MDNGIPQENGVQKAGDIKQRNNQVPEKPSIRHIMAIITERDAALLERNLAQSERRVALAERDMAIHMRDAAFAERDKAVEERNQVLQMLDSVISSDTDAQQADANAQQADANAKQADSDDKQEQSCPETALPAELASFNRRRPHKQTNWPDSEDHGEFRILSEDRSGAVDQVPKTARNLLGTSRFRL